MPNGRPGDHPLTDILHYGSSSFPGDINKTVIRLAALPSFEDVRERVADILWEDWPAWENVKPDFAKVREALRQIESEIIPIPEISRAFGRIRLGRRFGFG